MSNYSGGPKYGSRGGGGKGSFIYSTVGFSINTMNYFGELSPSSSKLSTDFSFTKPGFGLTYSMVVHPNAAIRAGVNWGTITGADFSSDPTNSESQGRYWRNLHFRNRILEFSLGGEFNFIPNNGGKNNRFPINPYLYFGVAVFKHNPQAKAPDVDLQGNPLDRAGEWVDLQPLGTEGQNIDASDNNAPYKLVQFAVPIGLGVKVRLPGNFDFNFEIGIRQTFTDYLDDVSTKYPDLSLLDSDLARAMSARGAESKALLTGDTRNPNTYDVIARNINGTIYNVGKNYGIEEPLTGKGGGRGGDKLNDVFIVTQLRIVYLLGKKSARRGKFR